MMTQNSFRSLATSLGLLCGAAAQGHAAQAECAGPLADYQVRYVGDDMFEVAARFERPQSRWDLAHFTPPDRPEGQSESVRDLKAFDADGNELPVDYVGEGGFETREGRGANSILYRLVADHDEADWNIGAPGKDEVGATFDQSYVFAGHAFFLLDWDMPRCGVTVSFDLPEGWQVTAPWPSQDGKYRIDDSWGLGQNMFAMGVDTADRVDVGGLSLTWLMDSQLEPVRKDVTDIMSVLPDYYTDLWGEAGGSRFSVFFMSDYMSDGGAFWDSFAMRFAVPLSEADKISWRHTLGHEVMHLWNKLGKRNGANVPELEWVNEGFTDYLTVRTMSRAGLLSNEMTEQRLANIVRRYILAGRSTPDVTLRTSGQDKGSNWQAVYGGGALVALLLDAELSRDDPDAFPKLLRSLRAEQGEGYDYDRFIAALDAKTDGRGGAIIEWVDSRPASPLIVERFRELGLDVSIFGYDEVYFRFPPCGEERCAPGWLASQTQ